MTLPQEQRPAPWEPLAPWHSWEDYRHGLYVVAYNWEDVTNSVALLSDPDQFREVALEMVREWPVAAHQNLLHMWSGRKAWIGQASCLYAHGAPGAATREAWGMLSDPQRRVANRTAEAVRERWAKGVQDAEALF